MTLKSIGAELSKSIKEQCWIHIEYKNQQGEITYFWAGIKDIYPEKQKIVVDMFNPKKYADGEKDILDATLFFSAIQKATVLDETSYDTPLALYQKIDECAMHLTWLNYDTFDHKTLTYLRRASEMDESPYQSKTNLIDGIDEQELINTEAYKLSDEQITQVIKRVHYKKRQKESDDAYYRVRTLALNDLSIVTRQGHFVIAYYPVRFNPKTMELVIKDDVHINKTFLTEGFTHNLKNYLDIEADEFVENYKQDKTYYKDILQSNLLMRETLDEAPYLMDIIRDIKVNLEPDYNAIVTMHEENKLNAPLKAFFGNMSKSMRRKQERSMVVLDDRVNIDQMRVIHNALKQYITYVQGPPGTGKTHTILNVLISVFFNDETALIASANNHPLDGIIEKLESLHHQTYQIPFPILRLGNKDYLLEALQTIKKRFNQYKNFSIYDEVLDSDREQKLSDTKSINDLLEDYEERLDIEDHLEVLNAVLGSVNSKNFRNEIILSEEKKKLEHKLSERPKVTNEEALKHIEDIDQRFLKWLNYMSIKRIKRLEEPRYKDLFTLIDIEDDDKRVKEFRHYLKDENNFRNLLRVFPFIASTLHSVPKLGPSKPQFDLTIIDEAGQANIAISLPALLRGDRLVLVGDPNQLNPVVTIDPGINDRLRERYQIRDIYNYANNSILKTMQAVDKISKFVLLRYHYRSQAPIINFSNRKYYANQLIIETPLLKTDSLQFYDVDNKETTDQRHEAQKEADLIKKIVSKYPNKSVGVITPFRKQKQIIERNLENIKHDKLEIGTIHAFQGDEKDIVIISPAVTKNSSQRTFNWLKDNRELLNVGTTRAKQELIVVADLSAIKKHSQKEPNDLLDLCNYVKRKKYKYIRANTDEDYKQNIAGIKALNTEFENSFLQTVSHLFTIYHEFTVKEKIMVKSVLDETKITDAELLNYYFTSEFDFVVYDKINKKPILAIELDGLEHYHDEHVKKRDQKKEELCKLYNLKLLRVPNDYARRYQYLRDIIIDMLKV